MEEPSSRRAVAAITSVGGILAGTGSILPWAGVSVNLFGIDVSENVRGTADLDGIVTLVAGVALAAAGLAALTLTSPSARQGLAAVALVAGLVVGALGLYNAVQIKTTAVGEIAESLVAEANLDAEAADELLTILERAIDVSLGIGVVLIIVGGVLGVVGGTMEFGRTRAEALGGPAHPPASREGFLFPEPPRSDQGTEDPPEGRAPG